MSFSDLGLSPETLKAVEDSGYTQPTPIQEQAIPYVLMGRDVLGIAQTGTGKTAGFTLPMIDILAHGRAKARMPRSLILAPTRELANQVAENFVKYGKYQKLNMALLIGGESMNEQKKVLEKGVDVLIATPGRLLDLFDRGNILLRDVKVLVIDEADRMLDMGFIPDVERIVSLLPPLRQTLFFSATMDKQIQRLADAFLSNPKEVRVSALKSSADTVDQKMVVVDEFDKREALRHILRMEDVRNAFIFCNRKRDVGVLYRSLTKHDLDAAQLHGDMPQSERTATLARFKAGEVRLLVCSDVAARGIDIADVSHVFNFDVPSHSEDYVHRIGRTGRAGREGKAYTIATPADTKYVAAVESQIGRAIPRLDLEGIETQELSEEAAKRARRRERSEPRGRSGRPRAAGDAPATPSPSPGPSAPSPRDRAEAAETRAETRNDTRNDTRSDMRNDTRNDRRGGKGRSNGRGRRGHPAWDVDEMAHADDVLAFGDHTPAFLLTPTSEATFASDLSDAAEDEAERVDDEVAESLGEAPADPGLGEAAPAERSRRRPSRRRKAAAPSETAAPVTEAAPTDPAVEATVPEEAPAAPAEDPAETETDAAAPPPPPRKRAPRRRTARKAAPEEGADEASSAASSDAATPPAAEGESSPAPAETAEDAPAAPAKAPARRAPRRKTAAAAQATGETEAPTTEAPTTEGDAEAEKPKRRRTTRKAATTAEGEGEGEGAAPRKAPARRTTRRKTPAKAAAEAEAEDAAPETAAPAAETPDDATIAPPSAPSEDGEPR